MGRFKNGNSNNWKDNMYDFLSWCEYEQKQRIPKGGCGQSISTTSGLTGFLNDYPSFEFAHLMYEKYLKENGLR